MNTSEVEFAIVGAGLSGLCMAMMLQRAGLRDFLIFEQAERPGGTWWHNRYPGARCDVHSHLYGYSFAPNPDWSRAYADRDEILAYLERCVREHGLAPRLRCRAEVASAHFDAAAGRWRLQLRDGSGCSARWLVLSSAPLHQPRLPDIPGIGSFGGELLHTARWDDAVVIDERRVGVIGTAASGVQVVPPLAGHAARLTVFQRSPCWLLPRIDWRHPSWLRSLLRQTPLGSLQRGTLRWGYEALRLGFEPGSGAALLFGAICRWQLRRQVPEGPLRRALTPDTALGCKRVLICSDYYPALQRPNVSLETTPIAAVTPVGVRLQDGREIALDVLVCATGFHSTRGAPAIELRGLDGRTLAEHWGQDVRAHQGLAVPGFPNLFMLFGPNTATGHIPAPLFIEAQARFVLRAHAELRRRAARWMEPRPEALEAWDHRIQQRLAASVWAGGCSSWYRNAAGRNVALYPGFFFQYAWELRRSRFDDYRFAPASPAAYP